MENTNYKTIASKIKFEGELSLEESMSTQLMEASLTQ